MEPGAEHQRVTALDQPLVVGVEAEAAQQRAQVRIALADLAHPRASGPYSVGSTRKRPPAAGCASMIRTACPARTSFVAHTSPLSPAPTTTNEAT